MILLWINLTLNQAQAALQALPGNQHFQAGTGSTTNRQLTELSLLRRCARGVAPRLISSALGTRYERHRPMQGKGQGRRSERMAAAPHPHPSLALLQAPTALPEKSG